MYSKTTSKVRVSVEPEYDVKNSFPSESRFVFKYNILIENLSGAPIKILRRNWLIYDIGFGYTKVAGEGVIGLMPEVHANDIFQYFSNVILRSGIGSMEGTYTVQNLETGDMITVDIPKFFLLSDILNN